MQRNFGVALGYLVIASESILKGLARLQVDSDAIRKDVADAWEVLAEAVQTVMRRYGIPEPYEKLKALTRGQPVTKDVLHDFIRALDIPDAEKSRLIELTPEAYIGLAAELATEFAATKT